MSDSDATAALHMHDGMVWCHPLDKHSQILSEFYRLCHFSKADRIPVSSLFQANNCFDLKLSFLSLLALQGEVDSFNTWCSVFIAVANC